MSKYHLEMTPADAGIVCYALNRLAKKVTSGTPEAARIANMVLDITGQHEDYRAAAADELMQYRLLMEYDKC